MSTPSGPVPSCTPISSCPVERGWVDFERSIFSSAAAGDWPAPVRMDVVIPRPGTRRAQDEYGHDRERPETGRREYSGGRGCISRVAGAGDAPVNVILRRNAQKLCTPRLPWPGGFAPNAGVRPLGARTNEPRDAPTRPGLPPPPCRLRRSISAPHRIERRTEDEGRSNSIGQSFRALRAPLRAYACARPLSTR